MLYYDYWPCCCRPKVAGFVIPVYINIFVVLILMGCTYLLTLEGDCYEISGLLGSGNCVSRAAVIAVLVWHLIESLINVFLLVGLTRKDRRFLIPWLVWFGLFWAGCLLYAFAEFFISHGDDEATDDASDDGGDESKRLFGPTAPTQARIVRQMWLVIVGAVFMYLWATILDLYFRMNPLITDDRIFDGVSRTNGNKKLADDV